MQAGSRAVLATVLVTGAACGSAANHAPGPAVGAPAGPVQTAADAFPARPPFVAPGERMSYRLTMHGVDVATFSIAVGEIGELSGRPVVIVQSGVAASPLVAMVKKVKDNFTSWIDAETSRTVMFRAAELASPDDPVEEWVDASPVEVVDGTYPVRVRRSDATDEILVRQTIGDSPIFDMNSFLMVLRTWEAPPGTTAVADVIRSRLMWRTRVTMGGFENLATALGDLPAVRIDGESSRLERDGTVDATVAPRGYSMWISDDADRVPLAIVARTDYGDLRMEIVDYQPGNGARLGR
jgi:hypothetical protein